MSEQKNWGASPEDWLFFDLMLGVGEDLLPVVSNQEAKISPLSKMKSLGKTPSTYNHNHEAVGLAKWTENYATTEQIDKWSRNPDYGICLIARHIHAIDLDILSAEDAQELCEIVDVITLAREGVILPRRSRPDSPKALLAFRIKDEKEVFLKRVITCQHGIVEFLGHRQQFVVAGIHPSGARYVWDRMADGFPEISEDTFEEIFTAIQDRFGIEKPRVGKAKREAIIADSDEPVLSALSEAGMVLSAEPDGRVHIVCPFEHEHTTESAESATTYWPAHTGGYAHASIKCLHAHCEARPFDEYAEQLGVGPTSDFEDITDEPNEPPEEEHALAPDPERFAIYNSVLFSTLPGNDHWFCEDVLPRAVLGVVYGASGSGKSFVIFDLICAVSRGVEWNGRETTKARVLYVCAEGQMGFRNRIAAYIKENDLTELDVDVMDGGPDLLSKRDIKAFLAKLQETRRYEIIVIDTYANCMSGDENSSKDVGQAITHCKLIHKATGAMVLLVHHSPKAGGGARGHSSLKAACDFELEVLRDEDRRMLSVTKMKDGGDDVSFGFRLKEVELREKANGKMITSCVVEYTNLLVEKTSNKEKLGSVEKQVHAVIQDLYEAAETWPDVNYVLQELRVGFPHIRKDSVIRAIENLKEKNKLTDSDGILVLIG